VLDYGTSASETIVFGDLADEVLTLLQATLGAPDGDSGWRNDAACTGETRRVTWGDLEIVLSRLETDDETIDTFEQWFVDSPGTLPVGLSTLASASGHWSPTSRPPIPPSTSRTRSRAARPGSSPRSPRATT
jgi:hypothetical protein